jgi:hypothetical protein
MAEAIVTLAPLDVEMVLPLGFTVRGTAGDRPMSS